MKEKKQNYYPISKLAFFEELLSGSIEEAENLYKGLELAKDRPHVLDNETLDRAYKLYTSELEMEEALYNQVNRWLEDKSLKESTVKDIYLLRDQRKKFSNLCRKILSLTKELKKGSINNIM